MLFNGKINNKNNSPQGHLKSIAAASLIGGCLMLMTTHSAHAELSKANPSNQPPVPIAQAQQIIISFKQGQSMTQMASVMNQVLGASAKPTSSSMMQHLQVMTVPEGMDMAEAMSKFAAMPQVAYVEQNRFAKIQVTQDQQAQTLATQANDPFNNQQWGLESSLNFDINIEAAWDQGTGSDQVIIAINDTGLDYTHDDIKNNLFINPDEIAGNGIDDDQNGFIDDVIGIDPAAGDSDPIDLNPMSHGTHIAGIIAAEGNNQLGMTGISWSSKILPCKTSIDGVNINLGAIILCLRHQADLKLKGHNIIASNNSWGGLPVALQALADAIEVHRQLGIMFITASGNESLDLDLQKQYPASHSLTHDNVMTISAHNIFGMDPAFSNIGKTQVHIAAPGVDIVSLAPGNGLRLSSGTSMAAPFAAGVLALHYSNNPNLTYLQAKALILAQGLDSQAFAQGTISGKRLQAGADEATPPTPPAPPVLESLDASIDLIQPNTVTQQSGINLQARILVEGTGTPPDATVTIKLHPNVTWLSSKVPNGQAACTEAEQLVTCELAAVPLETNLFLEMSFESDQPSMPYPYEATISLKTSEETDISNNSVNKSFAGSLSKMMLGLFFVIALARRFKA